MFTQTQWGGWMFSTRTCACDVQWVCTRQSACLPGKDCLCTWSTMLLYAAMNVCARCNERVCVIPCIWVVLAPYSTFPVWLFLYSSLLLGPIPWSSVAKEMGSRTDNMCLNRWHALSDAPTIFKKFSESYKERETVMTNFVGRKRCRHTLRKDVRLFLLFLSWFSVSVLFTLSVFLFSPCLLS